MVNADTAGTTMPHVLFEREIYLTAAAVIELHGEEALRHATSRVIELEKTGDENRREVWDQITLAILELERSWLRPGELTN